ncbi:MAG: hypothetical protein KF830_12925 [Planctomycetes bacterium]|nr:hypothetical protein [Planctomycetota bacterium]
MAMRAAFGAMLAGFLAASVFVDGGTVRAQGPLGWPSSVRTWGKFYCDTEGREGRFVRVAAGLDVTAALRADGQLFVNGENTLRQCVVPVPPPGVHYVDVAVTGFAMGLRSDGTIHLWGGGSPWVGVFLPPPAPALTVGMRYTSIAAGGSHALALRSDGSAVVWGDPARNTHGQLNMPAHVSQGPVQKISAMGRYSLALMADGTIHAWGDNTYGQCSVPSLPPGQVYVDVYAGLRHALAVRSDGQAVAWGEATSGKCNVPPLPPGTVYELVAAGDEHSYALRSDQVLVAWGNNLSGQGDVPSVPAGDRCIQLASGMHHGVCLLASGMVLSWGFNSWLQAYIPVLPKQPRPARHVMAAAGRYHNLALLSTHEIIGWGSALHDVSSVPAWLQGRRWIAMGSGDKHNVALAADGTLHAWGDNSAGQCNVPALPPGVHYTTKFSVGPGHTVARRSDGEMVAFGSNAWGCSTLPPLPPGVQYVDVHCNSSRTLLLRSDGAIVNIGNLNQSQLVAPSPPPGLAYVEVAGAWNFSAALRSDGVVVHWGSPPWTLLPTLPFGVCYVQITAGEGHLSARRSDGEVDVMGVLQQNQDLKVPLVPGTSYVEVSAGSVTTTARVGPTCTYVSFGSGCSGSRPTSRLVPRDTPHLGKTLQVTLFDLPQDLAVLAFGWQRLPAPVDLGFLGMPGCNLHVSLDALVPLVGQNGQAKWLLPIPSHPLWVGTRFYNQALVLDQAAGNAFGAVLGDAAEAVIGHW